MTVKIKYVWSILTLAFALQGVFVPSAYSQQPALSVTSSSSSANSLSAEEIAKQNQRIIEGQMAQVKAVVADVIDKFQKTQQQKRTLVEQVASMRGEINTLDNLILEARTLVGTLEQEIQTNQKDITDLQIDLKNILKLLQTKQNTPLIQTIFNAKNMGELVSEMYSLYNLESRASTIKTFVEAKTAELQKNLINKKEVEANLNKSRDILKIKESDLAELLKQTENDEQKYSQLVSLLEGQKQELENNLTSGGEGVLSHGSSFEGALLNAGYSNYCGFVETSTMQVNSDFFAKPVKGGVLAQGFGCGHDGLDIAGTMGTMITAIADGTVERVGKKVDNCVGFGCNGGYGNYVTLRHQLPDRQVVFSLYGHMMTQSGLNEGDKVKKGDLIGPMGCTGYTDPFPCGVHLHLMIFTDSYLTTGFACRLGRSKCYDPASYMKLD